MNRNLLASIFTSIIVIIFILALHLILLNWSWLNIYYGMFIGSGIQGIDILTYISVFILLIIIFYGCYVWDEKKEQDNE